MISKLGGGGMVPLIWPQELAKKKHFFRKSKLGSEEKLQMSIRMKCAKGIFFENILSSGFVKIKSIKYYR